MHIRITYIVLNAMSDLLKRIGLYGKMAVYQGTFALTAEQEWTVNSMSNPLEDLKAIISKCGEHMIDAQTWHEQKQRYKAVVDYVNSLGWIPCKDRLPDRSGWFLTSDQYSNIKLSLFNAQTNTWQYSNDSVMTLAWMPMPEPYNGGTL